MQEIGFCKLCNARQVHSIIATIINIIVTESKNSREKNLCERQNSPVKIFTGICINLPTLLLLSFEEWKSITLILDLLKASTEVILILVAHGSVKESEKAIKCP